LETLSQAMSEEGDVKMNRDFCDELVNRIEYLSKEKNNGRCDLLDYYALETRKLMNYGEYRIAVENLLSNIHDSSIVLDKRTIELARQSFGKLITEQDELVLRLLTELL